MTTLRLPENYGNKTRSRHNFSQHSKSLSFKQDLKLKKI